VTTRLPRIAPDQVLEYGEYKIPAGVSSSFTVAACRTESMTDTSLNDITLYPFGSEPLA